MAQYIGVDGIARTVKKQYVGVDGIARNVKKGYVGVDGIARQVFAGGKRASEYDVGDSVFLPFNGAATEFIIVHQGNPDDSVYDPSCEGTWLLMKTPYHNMKWDSTDNDYQNSSVRSYLNGNTFGLFDSDAQSYIKRVKIPYWKGTGTGGSPATGSAGLSANVFLLSCVEVGFDVNAVTFPKYGACLDYFYDCEDSQRSTGSIYWLRDPLSISQYGDDTNVSLVSNDGTRAGGGANSTSRGLRPALVLDFDALFDPETNILV